MTSSRQLFNLEFLVLLYSTTQLYYCQSHLPTTLQPTYILVSNPVNSSPQARSHTSRRTLNMICVEATSAETNAVAQRKKSLVKLVATLIHLAFVHGKHDCMTACIFQIFYFLRYFTLYIYLSFKSC